MVVYSQAKSKEDESKSYSDYLTWTNRKLKKILEEVKREASEQFLAALSKL